jgi:TPR repeat protein
MRNASKGWREIQKLKRELRRGSSIASNNIAATYRELGNRRRAFHWWRRTAGPNYGDAWLEVGYCLQYGVGTRRDPDAAIKAYRKAVDSDRVTTTAFGEEEAQYHLAVAILDRGAARNLPEVRQLLARAAADGDYPQAKDLLEQLAEGQPLTMCRCRRRLARHLGGKANCELHRERGASKSKRRH